MTEFDMLRGQLKILQGMEQTPKVQEVRRLIVDRICAIEVEQWSTEHEEFLERLNQERKAAWDKKWDAGIVEYVLHVQKELKTEEDDGRYKIISIS